MNVTQRLDFNPALVTMHVGNVVNGRVVVKTKKNNNKPHTHTNTWLSLSNNIALFGMNPNKNTITHTREQGSTPHHAALEAGGIGPFADYLSLK